MNAEALGAPGLGFAGGDLGFHTGDLFRDELGMAAGVDAAFLCLGNAFPLTIVENRRLERTSTSYEISPNNYRTYANGGSLLSTITN